MCHCIEMQYTHCNLAHFPERTWSTLKGRKRPRTRGWTGGRGTFSCGKFSFKRQRPRGLANWALTQSAYVLRASPPSSCSLFCWFPPRWLMGFPFGQGLPNLISIYGATFVQLHWSGIHWCDNYFEFGTHPDWEPRSLLLRRKSLG